MTEKIPQFPGLPHHNMKEGDVFSTPAGARMKILRRDFRPTEQRVRFLVVSLDANDNEIFATHHWTGYMSVKKPTLVE